MAMAAGLRTPATPNLLPPSFHPPARKNFQFHSSLRFPGRGEKALPHQKLASKTLTSSLPPRFFIRNEHPRRPSSPPSAVEPGQTDAVLFADTVSVAKIGPVQEQGNRGGVEVGLREQGRGNEIGDHGPQGVSGSASLQRVYESVIGFLYLASDIVAFLIQVSVIVFVWSLKIVLKSPFWCIGAIFRSIGRVFWFFKTVLLG